MAHAKLKLLKEKHAALIARIKQEENKVRAKERKSDTRARCLPVLRCWNGRQGTMTFPQG
jgi:hypothetical protein